MQVPRLSATGDSCLPITRAYGDHPRQKLDVYPGRGAQGDNRRPVLVFLYGGGWRAGERRLYQPLVAGFTAMGFCVVVPDYRLFPHAHYPDFVEDVAAAVAWTFRHIGEFGGDPARLSLMGHSAGAHMGALLLTNSKFLAGHDVRPAQVRAFVGLAGPYSFNPLEHDSTRDIFVTAADIDEARPIKHTGHAVPPMLLLHGGRDRVVGVHNSTNMATALTEAGQDCVITLYPRIGHISIVAALAWPLRWMAPVFRDSLTFVRPRLGR